MSQESGYNAVQILTLHQPFLRYVESQVSLRRHVEEKKPKLAKLSEFKVN